MEKTPTIRISNESFRHGCPTIAAIFSVASAPYTEILPKNRLLVHHQCAAESPGSLFCLVHRPGTPWTPDIVKKPNLSPHARDIRGGAGLPKSLSSPAHWSDPAQNAYCMKVLADGHRLGLGSRSCRTCCKEYDRKSISGALERGFRLFKPGSSNMFRNGCNSSPGNVRPKQVYFFWKRLEGVVDWWQQQVAVDDWCCLRTNQGPRWSPAEPYHWTRRPSWTGDTGNSELHSPKPCLPEKPIRVPLVTLLNEISHLEI